MHLDILVQLIILNNDEQDLLGTAKQYLATLAGGRLLWSSRLCTGTSVVGKVLVYRVLGGVADDFSLALLAKNQLMVPLRPARDTSRLN